MTGVAFPRKIYLVTGNPNKLRELQAVFPAGLGLEAVKIDLDEIQSLDPHKIVSHKLQQAYKHLGKPVIVEDVSAELDNLNGLPGPFVKFFEQKLGQDALYKLGGEGARVKIICTMGFYDGAQEIIVDGILSGTITAPRGNDGFGFDSVVVPDGYEKTLAELGQSVKNTFSHRYNATMQLAAELKKVL